MISESNNRKFIDDRYEVIEKLGQGGMGAVYLTRDLEIDRLVAVKLIISLSEPSIKNRLSFEAKSMAKLSHEGLVNIYDVNLTADEPYIVQEYVEGRDLSHLLREGRLFTEPDAWKFLLQMSSALECLHNAHIVHRDIKPDNIIQDEKGNYRLMDFGLALDFDRTRLTDSGVIVGTISYLPPEILSLQTAKYSSDIYQIAFTTYEMLTSVRPMDVEGLMSLVFAAQKGDWPITIDDPRISPKLKSLLRECLAFSPSERPANGRELRHKIELLQETSSIKGARLKPTRKKTAVKPASIDRSPSRTAHFLLLLLICLSSILAIFLLKTPLNHKSKDCFLLSTEWLISPKGLCLILPKKGFRSPTYSLSQNGKTTTGCFQESARGLEIYLNNLTPKAPYTLKIFENEDAIGEREFTLPSQWFSGNPKARFGFNKIQLAWHLHGRAKIRIVVSTEGSHRTIEQTTSKEQLTVTLPETMLGTEVSYALYFRKNLIFQEKGKLGIRPITGFDITKALNDELIVDGNKAYLQDSGSKLVCIEHTDTSRGGEFRVIRLVPCFERYRYTENTGQDLVYMGGALSGQNWVVRFDESRKFKMCPLQRNNVGIWDWNHNPDNRGKAPPPFYFQTFNHPDKYSRLVFFEQSTTGLKLGPKIRKCNRQFALSAGNSVFILAQHEEQHSLYRLKTKPLGIAWSEIVEQASNRAVSPSGTLFKEINKNVKPGTLARAYSACEESNTVCVAVGNSCLIVRAEENETRCLKYVLPFERQVNQVDIIKTEAGRFIVLYTDEYRKQFFATKPARVRITEVECPNDFSKTQISNFVLQGDYVGDLSYCPIGGFVHLKGRAIAALGNTIVMFSDRPPFNVIKRYSDMRYCSKLFKIGPSLVFRWSLGKADIIDLTTEKLTIRGADLDQVPKVERMTLLSPSSIQLETKEEMNCPVRLIARDNKGETILVQSFSAEQVKARYRSHKTNLALSPPLCVRCKVAIEGIDQERGTLLAEGNVDPTNEIEKELSRLLAQLSRNVLKSPTIQKRLETARDKLPRFDEEITKKHLRARESFQALLNQFGLTENTCRQLLQTSSFFTERDVGNSILDEKIRLLEFIEGSIIKNCSLMAPWGKAAWLRGKKCSILPRAILSQSAQVLALHIGKELGDEKTNPIIIWAKNKRNCLWLDPNGPLKANDTVQSGLGPFTANFKVDMPDSPQPVILCLVTSIDEDTFFEIKLNDCHHDYIYNDSLYKPSTSQVGKPRFVCFPYPRNELKKGINTLSFNTLRGYFSLHAIFIF